MSAALMCRYNLICFCAVLAAIIVLYAMGTFLAFSGKPMEALGLGGAGTGLIGILGTFKPRADPMQAVARPSPIDP